MNAGPRAGQYVMQNVRTRLIGKGVSFPYARVDCAACAPGRAAIHTGLNRTNHGVGAGNTQSDYYTYYRQGKKVNRPVAANGTQWQGPWEMDLAKQAGLADTPVNPSSQPIDTSGGNVRAALARGDTSDDLQAFTGGISNWLDVNGVAVAYVGKYQNQYGTTGFAPYTASADAELFVPPGFSYWFCESLGDAANDWYHQTFCFYEGANPGDGNGKVGTSVTTDYDVPLTSCTWAAGVATVTTAGQAHLLAPGDEFAIVGANKAGYNVTTGIVSGVTSATVFTFALVADPGGTSSNAGIVLYPRSAYSGSVMQTRALDFLRARRRNEPWVLFVGLHAPHQSTTGLEYERRYKDTVDPLTFADFGGVDGAVSPVTIQANVTGSAQNSWQDRQQMLASADDLVGQVMDYCQAQGWYNVSYIWTSDNGMQIGEQEAIEGNGVWDFVGGKGYVWEGSARLPIIVKHPGWPAGWTSYLLAALPDIPLTLLDWFGLTTHHAHSKRDGYSLQRLLFDPTDPVRNRAMLLDGTYKGNLGIGIVDQTLKKYVESNAIPSDHMLFDLLADYEVNDIAGANATLVASLQARVEALRDTGRWDVINLVNTCRTI